MSSSSLSTVATTATTTAAPAASSATAITSSILAVSESSSSEASVSILICVCMISTAGLLLHCTLQETLSPSFSSFSRRRRNPASSLLLPVPVPQSSSSWLLIGYMLLLWLIASSTIVPLQQQQKQQPHATFWMHTMFFSSFISTLLLQIIIIIIMPLSSSLSSSSLSSSFTRTTCPAELLDQQLLLALNTLLIPAFQALVPTCWLTLLMETFMTITSSSSTSTSPTNTTRAVTMFMLTTTTWICFFFYYYYKRRTIKKDHNCQQHLNNIVMPPPVAVVVTSIGDAVLQSQQQQQLMDRPYHDIHQTDDTISWTIQRFFWLPCCLRSRGRGIDSSSTSSFMNPPTNNRSTLMLDKCQWYEWNALQSYEWIISQQQQQQHQQQQQRQRQRLGVCHSGNHDIDNEQDMLVIADCLLQENLTLIQVLMQTSAVELKQVIMPDIPYGTILALRRAIHDDLQVSYPCPDPLSQEQQQQPADCSNHHRGWLAQYDQEYNNNSHNGNHLQGQRQSQQHDKDDVATILREPPLPPGGFDSLRQSMKDRYGLELPEMHNHRDDNLATPRLVRAVAAIASVPVSPITMATSHAGQGMVDNHRNGNVNLPNTAPSSTSSSLSFLPPEFLANVPSHISEIMRRKPELVQQILASSSSQRQQQQQKANATSIHHGEENMDNHDDDDDNDDVDDESSDCEQTKLLLRQRRGGGGNSNNNGTLQQQHQQQQQQQHDVPSDRTTNSHQYKSFGFYPASLP